jgi:hypothetical protein
LIAVIKAGGKVEDMKLLIMIFSPTISGARSSVVG